MTKHLEQALSCVAIQDTVAAFNTLSNHSGAYEQPALDYFEIYYISWEILTPDVLCIVNMHTRVQNNLPRTIT